ncbi:MAG: hypothetical protein ACXVY3_08550 [Gaiellaceae bacterium]
MTARGLLDASDASHEAIEDTLTSGYAHALALEAQRRRLERQILEAATERVQPAPGGSADLSRLADEFWRADAVLRDLREMLDRLRRHERARRRAEANGVA